MGKFGNNPNKGFISELAKNPSKPATTKKAFDYSKPVVKPSAETGSTLRRIQEKRAVAAPKSNLVKETLARQTVLRSKHAK